MGYNNEGVVGGVAEFKKDSNMKMHYPQVFADMVRVSSLLVHDALIRGNIIDKVVVYGLLTSYSTGTATVMKCYVNFLKRRKYFVGEELDAVRGLVGIAQAMKFFDVTM